jgi:hypothetical protein
MKRVSLLIGLAVLGMSGLAGRAAAQSCTVTGTTCWVQFTLSMQTTKVLELHVSSTTVSFPTAGVADLNAGYVSTAGPIATVNANTAWNLAVSSGSQTTWQTSGSGSTQKPASDLQWAPSPSGPFTGLSTTPAPAAQGNTPGSGFTAPLYLRTNVTWQADTPGQYGLTINYTLTAP